MNPNKSYPLSNFDIYKLLDEKCRILSYDELVKFKTLDDAMGHYGAMVLLYLTKENFGHWTLVFKYDNGRIVECFDSYGYRPDSEFEFIPKKIREKTNQMYPYLCKLLLDSGYKIVYNNYRLQEKKENVNSCGRHVVSRLIYRDVPIDEYVNMIKNSGFTADQFVTKLTNSI